MEQITDKGTDKLTSKILWLIQVETSTGVIYNSKMTYEEIKNLKCTRPQIANMEAYGIINKFVLPFTLDKFSKDTLKYVYIKRKRNEL